MDNFPKLVYKDRDYQDKRPAEPSPEQLKYSEEIAREKLVKIMEAGFTDFSVRFMNIAEYRHFLEAPEKEAGVIERECALFKNNITFKQFVTDYALRPEFLTDWDWATNLTYKAQRMLDQHVRPIMKGDSESRRKQLVKTLKSELPKHNAKVAGDYHAENLQVLQDFKKHPKRLMQPGAAREVLNSSIYLEDITGSKEGRLPKRQYELAVIYDRHIFGLGGRIDTTFTNLDADVGWDFLPYEIGTAERKQGILAAVSVVPLRDLSNEMIALEKGTGDLAHPVFDVLGEEGMRRPVIRWPKN